MAGNKRPKAKAAPRKRLLSKSPIVLGVSKEEKEFLKRVPQRALVAFQKDIANATCWYTVAFRLKVGVELAKAIYTTETVVQLQETMDVTTRIRERYHASGDTLWSATPEEQTLLELGLEAVDIIQDQTTRRDQLHAHLLADTYMKSVI